MARNPELLTHIEWLGYLQPVGLVVSPPALVDAQAFPSKNIIPEHTRFLDMVDEVTIEGENDPQPSIRDFAHFATQILGWEPADLVGTAEGGAVPDSLEVTLTEYNETLRPTYAVTEFSSNQQPATSNSPQWLMMIQRVKLGLDLDEPPETDSKDHHWQASPQARFERLLRETHVPIGLLSNGTHLRLVYAPRGETSGNLTFPVQAMTEVAGRPIFAALQMLLSAERLFTLPDRQRLPAILAESRKYQNLVSTKLAEQVLAALYELLRGFQAADDQQHGELLRDVLKDDPNQVYAGLLRVLLRLVFILYAEDRSLLSNDEVYEKYYSVIGLFERLRENAGRFTDTMDYRFGAWAQLLTLFRLIYDGGRHGGLKLLPRKGYLFDPDRYPFLEGRPQGSKREPGERTEPPRVSDGVVFRVLQNLLILDGERLSYRTLDVEQIGSVYEAVMGMDLHVAEGRSIALRLPKKNKGIRPPVTINLEELLTELGKQRKKTLIEMAEWEVSGRVESGLRAAKSIEDLVAVLEPRIHRAATPFIVPKGAIVLQPSEERRRTGSHYTPRSLTEPIVYTTLRPIVERLGLNPTPEQILDLKVCDPAMGSGAFLVAVCRFLAELLVKAWHAHKCVPAIPPDEDEILHARRLVAQRCLYGVDKNPMAVDLAKLSLWLATLAKDHPFTFLDHALRCGDSLVGLSRAQIVGFHWKTEKQRDFARAAIEGQLSRAMDQRRQIREAPEGTPEALLREKLQNADGFIEQGRRYGDLVVSAFFAGDNDRRRKERLDSLLDDLSAQQTKFDADRQFRLEAARDGLRQCKHALIPFHWEIEFPEVFARENPGFDAFVGNPPFLGGLRISAALGTEMLDYLGQTYEGAGHMCDLVAYFFRLTFQMIRTNGTFGLIATNSIAQGDTRNGGLTWICTHEGIIFNATRRYRWPGQAAVVVSIVHVSKGSPLVRILLDGKHILRINSYLFAGSEDHDPRRLSGQNDQFSQGVNTCGSGFLIGPNEATSIEEMNELIRRNPDSSRRIRPYIGGEEVNQSPTQSPHRYVICLSDVKTEDELINWPELARIVREKVKPQREVLKSSAINDRLKRRWWAFHADRVDFFTSTREMERVLVIARVGQACAFCFLPTGIVYSEQLVIFALPTWPSFSVLQSRIHEVWARFFSSSMKDDLRYAPSDCFETFPFPENSHKNHKNPNLEEVGRIYYEFRSDLMVRNNEGLTKTYNRFHDPDERSPDIGKLRELHAAMDRAVLDAYDWTDLKPTCEFLLDYEEDEDESGGGRRRKKPWRYRWPDDFRDEVLARLLE
ncbi:MAG TPA: DNA methyltransferase, partial [Isosphaeraceae bacterium]|nr:DNA methyltransferase [Isosphaeraceae bacterium]